MLWNVAGDGDYNDDMHYDSSGGHGLRGTLRWL